MSGTDGRPTPAGGREGPPPWFIPAIGLVVVVATVLAFVRLRGDDGTVAPVASSPGSIATPTTTPSASPSASATASPPPSPSPTVDAVVLGESCVNEREGYAADYPSGWVSPTRRAWACQLFDPQPFVVVPQSEPPIVAVSIYVERYPLEELLAALTDPAYYRIVSVEQGTFADAGRPGTILETEQTEDLFWPSGTHAFSVLVDRVDSTIVVTTNDLAASDYDTNTQIVLAMAESLRVGG